MNDLAPHTRRPGVTVFAVAMAGLSAVLLWSAHGISGFEALSAAGSVPMAATAVMLAASIVIASRTARRPKATGESVRRDVLPGRIVAMTALLLVYAVLMERLGFLPTSALFLGISFRLLSGRSWAFAGVVTLGSVVAIWLIFRIVFTVLMPSGIVPEAEFVQILRNLAGGR